MTNNEAIKLIEHLKEEVIDLSDNEIQAFELAIKALKERPQGEFAEKLKDRIEESVCKYCQMNKHCELCEISRVFQIITLTAEEQKGGADK